jgi:hypothetical protein
MTRDSAALATQVVSRLLPHVSDLPLETHEVPVHVPADVAHVWVELQRPLVDDALAKGAVQGLRVEPVRRGGAFGQRVGVDTQPFAGLSV